MHTPASPLPVWTVATLGLMSTVVMFHFFNALIANVCKHCGECFQIAMNIADDCPLHSVPHVAMRWSLTTGLKSIAQHIVQAGHSVNLLGGYFEIILDTAVRDF